MEITLTPDIEKALKIQAGQHGVTPEQFALASLREALVSAQDSGSTESRETLADYLADSIGVLHSSKHPLDVPISENSGKKFADLMASKRQEGRL